jgi:hypothetical protein
MVATLAKWRMLSDPSSLRERGVGDGSAVDVGPNTVGVGEMVLGCSELVAFTVGRRVGEGSVLVVPTWQETTMRHKAVDISTACSLHVFFTEHDPSWAQGALTPSS